MWPSVLFDLGFGPDLVNRSSYYIDPTDNNNKIDKINAEDINELDLELLKSDDEIDENDIKNDK